jgi:DNA polymerase epsilon subunit 2
MSSLEVEDHDDEEDLLKDPREWLKVVGAFDQPRMIYNVTQKHFDKSVSRTIYTQSD